MVNQVSPIKMLIYKEIQVKQLLISKQLVKHQSNKGIIIEFYSTFISTDQSKTTNSPLANEQNIMQVQPLVDFQVYIINT